jgi:tRNA1(Val) A37 N6-methylase TrmN6
MEYSILSKELTKNISKIIKKENGIYFTPPDCVYNNLDVLKPYFKNINNILEPSCGSGEYITAINKFYPKKNILAIEFNDIIYNNIQSLKNNKINILNENFITYNTLEKFDLIIGNPPFYIMKKKDVDKNFYKYFDGRPNIFILFIIKSLTLLSKNGLLSFILPTSFLNCSYYEKTREYIYNNFQIIDIIKCNNKYIETEQETITFILSNSNNFDNSRFIINIHNNIIFGYTPFITRLKELYLNSTSLYDLGFRVSVGNIVWNQCKDILTSDNTKTRLIYSSDILNNKLIIKEYKNLEKLNYINKIGYTEPLLIINRGYGKGKYNFSYCLINNNNNNNFQYLIENHLICIKFINNISNLELVKLYKKIIKSFKDNRTTEFIDLYFNNNAINTIELNYILPIFEDI